MSRDPFTTDHWEKFVEIRRGNDRCRTLKDLGWKEEEGVPNPNYMKDFGHVTSVTELRKLLQKSLYIIELNNELEEEMKAIQKKLRKSRAEMTIIVEGVGRKGARFGRAEKK